MILASALPKAQGLPMRSIILIQPQEGVYNKVLKPWAPLSLLAAAVKLDAEGYPVKIIDQRVNRDWRNELVDWLQRDPVCVGITSMTGSQILGALEASRLVKQRSRAPVVWGGAHATLYPRLTLANDLVDAVVKGEGEETFYKLVKRLENREPLVGLAGSCYKENGDIVENDDRPFIDLSALPQTPYHLVDVKKYLHRFFSEEMVVEIESSRGCPFACGFCYNPLYSKRRWRALSPEKVIERIRILMDQYGVHSFHFIDDAFFIDRDRVEQIMRGIIDQNLKVKLGFQGVRIDTFEQLSDADIALLSRAGTRFLQFGVESGSPRILEIINKKIRLEQVTSLNRRLASFPDLIPYYNFMCGFPTETVEDLFMTTALVWTLLEENKNTMVSPFHHYKPYPGTALSAMAHDQNYVIPRTLEEWGHFDWTESIERRQDKGILGLMKNIEMVSIFADRKMENQSDSGLLMLAAKLYRPIARFRLRHNFYTLMPEGALMRYSGGSSKC